MSTKPLDPTVTMTDGKSNLKIPESNVHYMESFGWEQVDESAVSQDAMDEAQARIAELEAALAEAKGEPLKVGLDPVKTEPDDQTVEDLTGAGVEPDAAQALAEKVAEVAAKPTPARKR